MDLLSDKPGSLGARVTTLLDGPDTPKARPEWVRVIEVIVEAFGGDPFDFEPFIQSWQDLYTATLLLDHLQDGDKLAPSWFAQLPQPVQYHLVFSAYALAQSFVIGPYRGIPEHRVARLVKFWSVSVTLIAEGQYRDLTEAVGVTIADGQSPLDVYEAIIGLKAGSLFALGFGGAAILTTDSDECIEAAINAGKIFGMLLQYGDDLLDADGQLHQPSTITLERALHGARPFGHEEGTTHLTWAFIYATYVQSLVAVLAPLPGSVREAIRGLVLDTFGAPPEPIAELVKGIGEARDEP